MDLMCKLCAVPAFEKHNLSFSLSNLSGGDDPCRSRGVFYRATGERRRHDRRGGRRTRASSHRLPLLWHQETGRQSARWLSPQRSDPLYDTSSSWSAAASPSHACWWLWRDAEVQFPAVESMWISILIHAGLWRFGAGLALHFWWN